ncbi:MAG: 4-hydroxythreonine-4-phosphate dehydrogenase PdxA, partial [Chitinivibrionales bacterium]|nr:4-hydroxythreonine-4-phosphate dehydrogenase PdxA [Chitinivibrionales bacterium]MBD3357460.1 4-hydroxythreonine-4-phosphate dehydrogenase PdxA [Chitinivibrionales bacterium]
MSAATPLLALTMGDPAGVGPTIAVKALAGPGSPVACRVFVVGNPAVMERARSRIGVTTPIHVMKSPEDLVPTAINVLPVGTLPDQPPIGRVDAACGRASFDYIITAIDLTLSHAVDGIVTNPINKEALRAAGLNYPGHTEILAEKTGTHEYTMMFVLGGVAVVHVTTHCSLRKAIDLVDRARVLANIRLLDGALRDMGHEHPR